MPKNKQSGFTLIELLVVISIIGILASVVMASLDLARAKARDAKRMNDMHQIGTALELFFVDHTRYPDDRDGVPDYGQMIGVGNEIDIALAPYMNEVPIDPTHDAGTGETPAAGSIYFYAYDPRHITSVQDQNGNEVCSDNPAANPGWTYDTGITFGFNKAESGDDIYQDTCSGSNLNLSNADFNRAVTLVKDCPDC